MSRVGDREETLISPEQQAETILAFAKGRGLEVEMLEPELDVSGGRVSRPILDAAIDRIERGEAEGIVVFQLDRLSRMSLSDALRTLERIESAGGEVLSAGESFDVSTPEGASGREIFLSFANMQRQRARISIARSKAQAIERGIWPMPRIPRGYVKGEDRHLVPGPDAKVVRRAFELRAGGASWRQVGNALGCGASGASKTIANRVYLGEIRVGEWVNTSAHPAIVSRELFEAAQLHHPRPPRGSGPPPLLAGIVRCAECQGSLTLDTGYYRCKAGVQRAAGRCPAPAGISRRTLEPYVEEVVLGHLEVGYRLEQAAPATAEAHGALEAAEAELTAYQEAIRIADIGAEAFAAGMRQRQAAVEAARRELALRRLASAPERAIAGDVRALWPELDVVERRHVLRGALGVVWVRKGRGAVGPDRVRLVVAGHEPSDLPRSGGRRFGFVPIEWGDERLYGEIRMAAVEDPG